METLRTTPELEQTPAAPRRSRLWLWRGLTLTGLLVALWLYVLPYQTGVRLDKSLSGWVSDHPDWTLEREERSLYQRHYRLYWQPDWATEPVVLDARVFSRPFGWSSPAGRQWGWATFAVQMDPYSPVQIRNLPDRAIEITGQVESLGLVRFNWAAGDADSNQLVYDRSGRAWQGTLNLPGWQVITPSHRFLFGRTLIDLRLHHRAKANDAFWHGLDGEIGIDIRRIGWGKISSAMAASTETSIPSSTLIGSSTSGLIDHFQWRIRLMPDLSGGQWDVIGSGALDALQLNGRHLGGGQLAFAVYAADPDFAERFAALGRHLLFSTETITSGQVLAPVLSSLQSAEIRLDALRWQTPTGNMDISGKAFGPQFAGLDPLTSRHQHKQSQADWQAQVQLQFGGAIMQAPLINPLVDWLNSWLPEPIPRFTQTDKTPVRLILAYSPEGWVLHRPEAQRPPAP
mgnify:CR=1 FL=1